MSRCDDIRELLSARLDGELEVRDARDVERHLAECQECADLARAMGMVSEVLGTFRHLDPPPRLEADLAASPCRRWLGLLMSSIDRDIEEHDLDRLLGHLEGCTSCARVWTDLSLVHQISEAMLPPAGLAERCAAVRRQPRRLLPRPRHLRKHPGPRSPAAANPPDYQPSSRGSGGLRTGRAGLVGGREPGFDRAEPGGSANGIDRHRGGHRRR